MVEAVAKEAVEEVTDAVEAAILNTAKEREVIMKTREAVEAVVEATNLAINPNSGTQVTKEQKKAKGLIKFTYSTESDADIKATELNVNIKTKEMGAVINAKERNAIINTRELEIVVKAGEAIAIDTITLNTPNKPGEAMAGESGETPEAEETREDIMKTREAVEAMVEAVKLAANPKTRTQVEEKQMKATDLAFTLIAKEMLEAKKKASDLIITINAQDTQVVEEQQKALNLIAIANVKAKEKDTVINAEDLANIVYATEMDITKAKNLANIVHATELVDILKTKELVNITRTTVLHGDNEATGLVNTINAINLAEESDNISEDLRQPSLPPGGETRDAEGGTDSQVDIAPSTRMDLNNTNSCFACTPAELTKGADLTTTIIKTNVFLREGQKKATDLGVIIVKTKVFMTEEKKKATTPAIIIKTWGDPGGS